MTRGYFAIGVEHPKTGYNIGSLWRSAQLYGAAFMFTVGRRYSRSHHVGIADTMNAAKHTPLLHFESVNQLVDSLTDCPLVGLELDHRSAMINGFTHTERACYILGAEDNGLSAETRRRCHKLVQLPGQFSMNVACAGTVIMHDRWGKQLEGK